MPRRYAGVLLPLLLSAFMTCIVSLISTLRVLGLAPNLLPTWLVSWAWSWAIAFPTLLVALPLTRRLVEWLVTER